MKVEGFKRILVAADGSEPAQAAVDLAITFARASEGCVRVAHVWSLEVHHRRGIWDVETRSEARELIARTVDHIQAFLVEADGEIVHSDSQHVAQAIAQVVRDFEADLVVVGSRGLSDWRSLILNHSVGHELLTRVDCPVLIVRGPTAASSHRSKRVLVAVAGGDDVEPAVMAAIAATRAPGSAVLVIHIPQVLIGAQGFAYVEPDEEIQQTMRQTASMLREAGVSVSTMVASSGPIVQAIVDMASWWNADVIVIGSSRMGDFGSLVFGSVTHGLLRQSERPVLVARRAS